MCGKNQGARFLMEVHAANYEEKKQSRIEYYEEKAEKNKKLASEQFEESRKMADVIPFGQPILVGHHSEKADRNYRKKIDNKMRKSIETSKKADYYEDKVKAASSNSSISQDDPEAIKKLKAKLERIEKDQEQIKAHNKKCNGVFLTVSSYGMADQSFIRNEVTGLRVALVKNGLISYEAKKPRAEIVKLVEEFVKVGKMPEQTPISEKDKKLPGYHLSSLSAEKSRIKKRIEKIQTLEAMPDIDEEINKIRIYTSDGRIKIEFGYKPSEETRSTMKRSGFRWSPYNQVWQSYINQRCLDKAREIAKGESS